MTACVCSVSLGIVHRSFLEVSRALPLKETDHCHKRTSRAAWALVAPSSCRSLQTWADTHAVDSCSIGEFQYECYIHADSKDNSSILLCPFWHVLSREKIRRIA